MACMCGDLYCPSCGPAQGNHRCPNCGRWTDEGGCEDPDRCGREIEKQDTGAYMTELEIEGYAIIGGFEKPFTSGQMERITSALKDIFPLAIRYWPQDKARWEKVIADFEAYEREKN